MTIFQVHVHLNAVEGREQDFERWYEDVHLPELFETVDGLITGRRYWLGAVSMAQPANRHVAIYEIDAASPDAALAAFKARREERRHEPGLIDGAAASIQVWEAAGPVHGEHR